MTSPESGAKSMFSQLRHLILGLWQVGLIHSFRQTGWKLIFPVHYCRYALDWHLPAYGPRTEKGNFLFLGWIICVSVDSDSRLSGSFSSAIDCFWSISCLILFCNAFLFASKVASPLSAIKNCLLKRIDNTVTEQKIRSIFRLNARILGVNLAY